MRTNPPWGVATLARGRAGVARAIAQGWLWRHESGTYVTFTDSAAALFA
jgi:hypothetical protein